MVCVLIQPLAQTAEGRSGGINSFLLKRFIMDCPEGVEGFPELPPAVAFLGTVALEKAAAIINPWAQVFAQHPVHHLSANGRSLHDIEAAQPLGGRGDRRQCPAASQVSCVHLAGLQICGQQLCFPSAFKIDPRPIPVQLRQGMLHGLIEGQKSRE